METKNIALTEQEANALLQLLNIAVKTQGMQAAQTALHLNNKVIEAFQEQPKKSKK